MIKLKKPITRIEYLKSLPKDEDGNPIELYKQRAPWLPAKLPTTPTTPAPKKGGGVGPLKLQPRQPQP